jgi:hypothetical protein
MYDGSVVLELELYLDEVECSVYGLGESEIERTVHANCTSLNLAVWFAEY